MESSHEHIVFRDPPGGTIQVKGQVYSKSTGELLRKAPSQSKVESMRRGLASMSIK
jgi:hypothetical protein